MIFLKGASSRIAFGAVILLIMSSMGATGLSSWKETANDFPAGQNDHTRVQNGGLTLDGNSGSPDWTKVGNDSFPPGREFNSMVYDSVNGIHIMFGGMMDNNHLYNRTWTYNGLQDKWAERFPDLSPSPRYGQALAFDSKDGVTVLFGGSEGSGTLNDTWTYNLTLDTWIEKHPATAPPSRYLHSMVYDPESGLIVLFGGQEGLPDYPYEVELGDTWVYDLANDSWANRTGVTGPSPRHGQSMCYDPSIGLIVLFGGTIDGGYDCYQDTWTYNATSNTWNERNPAIRPSPRAGAPMAADISSGTMFLFGGVIYGTLYNDGWSYNGSSDTWTSKQFSNGPPVRSYSVMTYDSPTRSFVLYGGLDGGYRDDYWSYDPAQNLWTKLDGLASPEPRLGASVSFDSANKVGVLFGGMSSFGQWHDDTWTYDASTNKWEKKHPASSPPDREFAAMCYDKDDGVIVLFGGYGFSGPNLADTWTYNGSSNTWTNCQPALSPSGGSQIYMAYDPNNHLVVLFGIYATYQSGNETWTYDVKGNIWTNRTKAVAPLGRPGSAMAYDEVGRTIILFGGGVFPNSPTGDETWSYNTTTFNWSQRFPTTHPSARQGHAMTFDPSLGEILLYGGSMPGSSAPFEDTWTYNGATDVWKSITPVHSPDPRYWSDLFYDSNEGVAVLFGGEGITGPMGDTWLLSPGGGPMSGSYTSVPKDTGGSAYFGTLRWDASTPIGTSIKLQLRTGASQPDMYSKEFTGPDGTTVSYFTQSGQMLSSTCNGSRWVQYRVFFTTTDISTMPILTSVTVNYNLLQSITITSPAGGANWSGVQPINWTAFDPDNDTLSFDIYLLSSSGIARLASGLPNDSREWLWNTSGVQNGTYKILIVASDDNPFIPLTVNTTSDGFIIYHPGIPLTNHLPHVVLIYPQNNSDLATNSVRLQWKGTDIDGDFLSYTARYSDQPFSEGNILSNITTAEYLDLTGLANNKTYYWTINATDGKANGTDVPTEIWSFTVKLPPANIPVRITSTPPTQAWVGEDYTYNITSIDEDGDIPIFSIVSGPPNMTLNPSTGELRWVPAASEVGNHTITVQVSDGRGSIDHQTFTITVKETPLPPPPEKPRCIMTNPIDGARLSGLVLVRGQAFKGSLPLVLVQVRIDNGSWMTVSGLDNWSLVIDLNRSSNGDHHIEARAFDGSLYSDSASVEIQVDHPGTAISLEGNPLCLPAIIIAVVAGLGILLVLRRKKGGQPTG